ncbi:MULTISPECIES: hypothetical protein [Klebsiella pneumoniae complex]|uniref:hypothetical protein n=1 Tax=Klebsiella pneumoniae complex TaxID=3390273 RepID=UPI001034BD50|nr:MULTISPECIES: hypothetical protein [Klebsiella]ELT0794613.1 hypothetical protein [Klebsiella quasipneumoniae]MBR7348514.1 hypothetical protein [Klebsiella pneumoniae]MBV0603040.1 hypothetical protein [Klebsiella pneumoniae]MBV0610526.1 hypothetical protein [Klebsiella pneumoniae]MBV0629681.1 hypothetical protein [Klebsiella pneumoniae]
MSKKTGGQAFPRQQWEYDGQDNVLQYQEEGMTLRDYFAAKAMQAMISNPSIIDNDSDGAVNYAASASYKFADAMLKARGDA